MPTGYIHFTDEQKEIARQTDIADLLRRQGETLKRSGSELEWRDGSQKVSIRGNLWFHQYERVGGDAIDFVRRYYNKSYPEAMEYLLGGCGGMLTVSPPVQRKPPKPFVLPEKNGNMRRVFAYLLNRRGIDRDVLYAFTHKGMIYESTDYHNAVFVGFDQDGIPRHAHKRGSGSESTYKGNQDGSLPEYSFHWHGQAEPAPNSRNGVQSDCSDACLRQNQGGRLYLFEAPIDMLSFISIHKEGWRSHSYAAACGVSDQVLWQMMKDNPKIQKVYLCLDSDEPGQAAAKRISDKLFTKGIQHEILVPIHKDWNEDLLCPNEETEEEGETECQALQL